MVKKIFILSFILLFLLAACQSAASSPTTDAPDQSSEAETNTELPPLPEVSPTPPAEIVAAQGEANCTVVSSQPTPGPTEQSLVPPVDAADWAHGPADARVTIIEYGDFQ
jgi:hypothetical protein